MIEEQTIDGKKAHVVYLDDALNPVDNKRDATLVKVLFADGETAWLVPSRDSDTEAVDIAIDKFFRGRHMPDEGIA